MVRFTTLVVRPYRKNDLEQLIEVYQSAFAEPPWDEYMKCKNCGVNYGKDEVVEGFVYDRRGVKVPYQGPKGDKRCEKCGTDIGDKRCKRCYIDLQARIINMGGGGFYAYNSDNFVPFWSREDIIEDLEFALRQKDPIVLVAEIDKMLVGFTWGYKIPLEKFSFLEGNIKGEASYVDEIAVKGDKRQRSIGTLLCSKYLETAGKQEMQEVILRTDERNVASMALFRKLGFSDIPDLKNSKRKVYDPEFPNRVYLRKLLGEQKWKS